jgi:periplasmic divalent cation tolerance protein
VGCELIVFVTTPTIEEANRIAEALVTQRLAACVNIISAIQSIYRWEGKVTRDQESLMVVKTTEERYAELERCVKELHSYSTPEVVALHVERGSEEYLNWLRESTEKAENQEPSSEKVTIQP